MMHEFMKVTGNFFIVTFSGDFRSFRNRGRPPLAPLPGDRRQAAPHIPRGDGGVLPRRDPVSNEPERWRRRWFFEVEISDEKSPRQKVSELKRM